MDKLKQGLRGAFLDEDRVFENISRKIAFRPLPKFKLAMTISSIVLTAMLIGMLLTRPTHVVAGVVSVDLNPSVRFELTDEFIVLKALPQNAQAESLDMKSLIGLGITDAIANLVEQTIEKGYIDRLSLTQDFILVTTIATDGSNTTFSIDLKSLLVNLQKENPLLSGMSIAFMEALRDDLEDADAQNIPFWIYLLQKENPDLDLTRNATVQSYFEDPILRSEFEASMGEVDDDDEDFDDDDLLEALDYLEKQGVDVSTYRDRLNQSDVSIEQLADEIKEVLEEDEHEDEDEDEDDENESEEDENDDEHDEEDD